MKTSRDFVCQCALIAGLSLTAANACNLILDNDLPSLGPGNSSSGGTGAGKAGAEAGGTTSESMTGGGGQASSTEGGEAGDVVPGGSPGTSGSNGDAAAGGNFGTGGSESDAAAGGDLGSGGDADSPPPPPGPLPAPAGITFTPTSETEVTLTWEAVDDATSYTIELATDAALMANSQMASATGTTTTFSGLNAGTLYYVRVRANGSNNRTSEWTNTSGDTLLNPPQGLTLDLYVSPQWTTIGYSGLLWIEPPDDLSNGGAGQEWHYARGTASAKCAAGAKVEYQFSANYDNDALKAYTAWGTTNVAYIVRPNGRVTFYVRAHCIGPNNKPSNVTEGPPVCRRNDGSAC